MPIMITSTTRQNDDPNLARWGLVALALVTGAFLMVYYVHLLQDSVARGSQWRYSQITAVPGDASESTGTGPVRLVGTRR
jgi:hypothetical protein